MKLYALAVRFPVASLRTSSELWNVLNKFRAVPLSSQRHQEDLGDKQRQEDSDLLEETAWENRSSLLTYRGAAFVDVSTRIALTSGTHMNTYHCGPSHDRAFGRRSCGAEDPVHCATPAVAVSVFGFLRSAGFEEIYYSALRSTYTAVRCKVRVLELRVERTGVRNECEGVVSVWVVVTSLSPQQSS